jgi:hypothetical protein
MKAGYGCNIRNVRPFFGRSVLRSREARTATRSGFSELNGFFFALPNRPCNCEQRPATATTRKTCCSLNSLRGVRPEHPQSGVSVQSGLDCVWNAGANSESNGWSSSPRPVNRLQATSEPRRVMRGGRKAMRLAPKNEGRPVQGKLSLSPKNEGLRQCKHYHATGFKPFWNS